MRKLLCLLAVAMIAITGCELTKKHVDDEDEVAVPLEKVPPKVMAAAKKAVPGLKVTSAYTEVENGKTIYEINGTDGGEAVEVEVSAAGKLLEIERGEDGDDDDDEGHDDDKD